MQICEEKGQRRTFYERADNLFYGRNSRDLSWPSQQPGKSQSMFDYVQGKALSSQPVL